MSNRRAFLKFLAASPLLAGGASLIDLLGQDGTLSAAEALDVFDLEAMARKVIPPAHWGYLATGVDGDETLQANRDGFARYQLRTRRLVDVSKLDYSIELFGTKFSSPIFLCPIGGQKAYHPEGEVGAAKAARTRGHLQLVSTQASSSIEEVTKARGGPVWYQLYTTNNFDVTTRFVKRAEAAGCPVVAVTVDVPAGRNSPTATRFQRQDTRVCANCHTVGPNGLPEPSTARKAMYAGVNMQGLTTSSPSLTWDFVKRLREVTQMKIFIKGLESAEDAALALGAGVDGIIVSNHGGRSTETRRATVESLPEVVQAVSGRIPVLLDSGVRRGTDVFKALALGATAVGIGRPYIWGLSAFGPEGVERVLDILNTELRYAMAGCGTRSIKEISPGSIIDVHRRG